MANVALSVLFMGVVFLSAAQAETTATLEILNPENVSGKVVVSKGTSIEVNFVVTGGLQ